MRTQITLNDEEVELLDRAAEASGASRSELIRRAIRSTYGSRRKEARMAALKRSAGSWRDVTSPVPTTSTPFAATS
ncbi:putative antitoxin VapB19 [Mycobacterium xenopi 4042]|uniref:Putative antitoxin VapB19 n=1 Tax=Mycobacterium xenopi 4042 TaxID=1299334 RepID=X8AH90_MYCXE|nr:putative antitoxin VapB19 [Mycobacterium xenopi 4042]